MKINKTITVAVVLFGLLVGGLGAGIFLTQRPSTVDAAPPAQADTACVDNDNVQHEAEGETDEANQGSECEENEADEVNEANETGEANEANETDKANEANETDKANEANEAGETD